GQAIRAGVLLMLGLGVLGLAVLGVAYRRGRTRAGWLGFALFGGGYLALTLGPWAVDAIRPQLATSQLLDALHAKLAPEPTGRQMLDDLAVWVALDTGDVTARPFAAGRGSAARKLLARIASPSDPEPFRRVDHGLFALLAGVLGATAARAFHATRGGAES